MWARLRTSINKDKQKPPGQPRADLNVNEEYLCAIRTKSFADFFLKAQWMVKNPPPLSSSSTGFCHPRLSETLLNPCQETIESLLESSPVFSNNSSSDDNEDLKSLLTNYFDISAQASHFCSQLLNNLDQIQSDYASIHRLISNANQANRLDVAAELRSHAILNDPFSRHEEFNHIHQRHSLILQHLRSKRKRIARKIKLIRFFNKATGVCATAACGLLAAAAVFLAVHTMAALLMGPAVLIFPIAPLKRKVRKFRLLKYGFLRKIIQQLDVAAKGAYILNRDFDTMSRLVTRVQDEVERNTTLIRFCLERGMQEDNNRVSCQVLKEIKKCELGFRQQVEELEEHVYLCLVTINRARALVVEEICRDCGEKSVQ